MGFEWIGPTWKNGYQGKIFYIVAMKAMIDIPETKAASIIPLTDEKFLLMQEIKESVKEMNEIKSKKKTARNAREFYNR